jgi:cell division transport system permease protein
MIAGLLSQTKDSIFSNLPTFLSGIVTTGFSLVIIGTFVLVYLNVIHLTQLLFQQSRYSVFVGVPPTDDAYRAVLRQIRGIDDAVEIQEISAEEARRELVESFGEARALLERLDFPRLPSIIEFELRDQRSLTANELSRLRSMSGVDDVVTGRETRQQIDIFFNIARFIGVFLIGLLVVSVAQIIHNSIQISIRIRIREIEILKILGAGNGFIRRPFIMEGMLIGGAGAIFALGMVYFLFQFVIAGITFNEATYPLRDMVRFYSLQQLLVILVVLIVLGAISSFFAARGIIDRLDR